MRKMFLAALSAVALTATMGAAQAAVVDTTWTFASTVSPDYAPVDYNFTLTKFDTSLGTLTGVSLYLTDTAAAYLDVTNKNGFASSYSDGYANVAVTVTGPHSLSFTNNLSLAGVSGTVAAHATDEVVGTYKTTTVSSNVLPWDLSAFLTDQNVTVSVAATNTDVGANVPGRVDVGGGALTSGSFEVVYTYAAVPEAAIWTMLILGFGMIGLVLRADRNSAMLRSA